MNRAELKRTVVTVAVLALVGSGAFRSGGWLGLLTSLGSVGLGWMLTLGWTEGREAAAYRRGYERRAVDDANARADWARKVREHQTRKRA